MPIGVATGYVRPRVVRPVHMDNQMITLRGVAPAAMDAILAAARRTA